MRSLRGMAAAFHTQMKVSFERTEAKKDALAGSFGLCHPAVARQAARRENPHSPLRRSQLVDYSGQGCLTLPRACTWRRLQDSGTAGRLLAYPPE